MDSSLTKSLKAKALELGFNMMGVVEARPSPRLWAYHNWLDRAFHGEMDYLARPDRVLRREDLNAILPSVKSIICVGLDYATWEPPPEIKNDPGRGRISNYAWGADYHIVMTPKLSELADWLRGQTEAEVANKVYVDTGAILERDHAQQAGLGFAGKNTMLINPRGGSWFFLGELLTTAELLVDEIKPRMPSCGSCSRCLTACPTNAFPEPHVLDGRRCISYLTIELKGWIPREFRPLMGNWIYGCDICQEVCPFNRFSVPSQVGEFYPAGWETVAPPLLDLLDLDEESFQERFANSPIRRIKRSRLVRNACVAAGNWGDQSAVPALIRLLGDDEPIIRGHTAWALGNINANEARPILEQILRNETNNDVVAEIKASLESMKVPKR
jgi:epoxyqueuosine reductase